MSATLYCPKCGTAVGLWRHNICADGTVEPSVDTPQHQRAYLEHDGCRFHGNVMLVGWEWGESPGRNSPC